MKGEIDADELRDMYLSICFFIALSWPFVGAEQGKMKLLLFRYIIRWNVKISVRLVESAEVFRQKSRHGVVCCCPVGPPAMLLPGRSALGRSPAQSLAV